MAYKIAIVGYGFVGKAMKSLFPDAVIYDSKPGLSCDKTEINKCDIAFVCVPTPSKKGGSCDISAVEDAVSWVNTPIIVIRSTVPPGTTKILTAKFNKNILFNPEYIGETSYHPYKNLKDIGFVIIGGEKEHALQVVQAYSSVCGPAIKVYFTDSKVAELAKYMENCFFATKLIFCYEFFKIAEACGVNYKELREVWLADSRISRDHTEVFQNSLGFDGKCLPKDLSALINFAKNHTLNVSLLEKVAKINQSLRQSSME